MAEVPRIRRVTTAASRLRLSTIAVRPVSQAMTAAATAATAVVAAAAVAAAVGMDK
jgi:hypothetical protein